MDSQLQALEQRIAASGPRRQAANVIKALVGGGWAGRGAAAVLGLRGGVALLALEHGRLAPSPRLHRLACRLAAQRPPHMGSNRSLALFDSWHEGPSEVLRARPLPHAPFPPQ